MADVAIRAAAAAAVPRDYTIPGAQEILPKSVSASMDGSAAASAWFPCLQVLDPGGNVMFSAVPVSSIAAGVSADVSWFPHIGCCPTSTTNYTTSALAFGPWAYYTLADTGSLTFLDTSGHGRTCSYDVNHAAQGGPAIVPNAALASAVLTGPGGTSNSLVIASISGQLYTASVFTLTSWIKTSYAGANDQIIAGLGRLDSSATSLFAIWLIGHIPVVRMYDNTLTIHSLSGSVALNDGLSHMVAASYDGTTLRLYVDGVQVNSSVLSVTMNTNQTIDVAIAMQLGGVSPRTFSGDLAQIGYFDQVLTGSEIAALYNTGASSVAAVESVLAADASITAGGSATNVTLQTGSLDVIAVAHPTGADWSNNSHKITSVLDPSNAQDAATKNYVDTHGGTVSSVTAADTSIVIGGTAANPTVATGTLDVIATNHAPAADWSNNSKKITNVTDPGSAQDAATKHYVDAALPGAGAYVLLASSVLAASALSFDFSGLSGSYTMLRIFMQLRSDRAAGNFERVGVRFNNDSAANYDWAFAGSASASASGDTAIQLSDAAGGSGTAQDVGRYDLSIVGYSVGSTFYKSITGTGWTQRTNAAASQFAYTTGGIWRSTSTITRITILPFTALGGNWVTGSAVYIYGIA